VSQFGQLKLLAERLPRETGPAAPAHWPNGRIGLAPAAAEFNPQVQRRMEWNRTPVPDENSPETAAE